ncbi:hypothetical protein EIP91_005633 [Steccherinum ochraceum]|uniref:Uncharacterized protein n=1 Tax=Steccherinum ochraceum TaxID=92696 RepID=A0A4R0RD00_9APHY|nr:hypothetical protein EIP91_005633 [Steccherinum ochraceum]
MSGAFNGSCTIQALDLTVAVIFTISRNIFLPSHLTRASYTHRNPCSFVVTRSCGLQPRRPLFHSPRITAYEARRDLIFRGYTGFLSSSIDPSDPDSEIENTPPLGDRLTSPLLAVKDLFAQVEDLPAPSEHKTVEALKKQETRKKLFRLLGACSHRDKFMALYRIPCHPCALLPCFYRPRVRVRALFTSLTPIKVSRALPSRARYAHSPASHLTAKCDAGKSSTQASASSSQKGKEKEKAGKPVVVIVLVSD